MTQVFWPLRFIDPSYNEVSALDQSSYGFYIGGKDVSSNRWQGFRAIKGGASIDSTITQFICSSVLYGWDVSLSQGRPIRLGTSDSLTVDIVNSTDTANTFDHGAKSAIGTTAVQITTTSIAATKGVIVRASRTNTLLIYVGNSDVTAGTADATDGYELSPGENIVIPVNNANEVYVRSTGAGQRVSWMVA